MRIISGKYGGRKLKAFKADHIRPTTDRVKETLFNKIQAYLGDARVLDLYAGTGSLGLEALSRGASHVVAVELNRKSQSIIKQNVQLLKIQDEYELVGDDVFKYLKYVSEQKFDVIFVDPPFTKAIAHDSMEALAAADILSENGVLAIESSKQERIDDDYAGLELLDRKNFGDKYLSLFRKN